MSAITGPSNLVALKAAITAQCITEMVSGRLCNTYFPSVTPGIAQVGSSWLNEIAVYPYVSVWAAGRTEDWKFSGRRTTTHNFVIGLSYKSTISLDDAYTNLYNMMDNGQGQGLEAVLRDATLFTWGGLCNRSQIVEVQYYDNALDTSYSATNNVAYAVIKYQAVQLIPWSAT